MNVLNFYTSLYGALYNRRWLYPRMLSPLRFVVRKLANYQIPSYLSKGCSKIKGERYDGLIVSFTSFPARIDKVWMVVECLKRQTVLPEKIILWLSKEQFPHRELIPQSLWSRVDDLFEIRMVDGDLKSHKKYYYAFSTFPNKKIITVDDDVFYHTSMIWHLVMCSRIYPNYVISNMTKQFSFDNDGNLLPYEQWQYCLQPFTCHHLIQIGVGGVLYPPNRLHLLTLRDDLFSSLAPSADDLWLNCMARLKGTLVIQSNNISLPLEIANNSPSLSTINMGNKQNDRQIFLLRNYLHENKLLDVYNASEQN